MPIEPPAKHWPTEAGVSFASTEALRKFIDSALGLEVFSDEDKDRIGQFAARSDGGPVPFGMIKAIALQLATRGNLPSKLNEILSGSRLLLPCPKPVTKVGALKFSKAICA